nr:hypothetical protein CFP56_04165 [Quercus suber]
MTATYHPTSTLFHDFLFPLMRGRHAGHSEGPASQICLPIVQLWTRDLTHDPTQPQESSDSADIQCKIQPKRTCAAADIMLAITTTVSACERMGRVSMTSDLTSSRSGRSVHVTASAAAGAWTGTVRGRQAADSSVRQPWLTSSSGGGAVSCYQPGDEDGERYLSIVQYPRRDRRVGSGLDGQTDIIRFCSLLLRYSAALIFPHVFAPRSLAIRVYRV